MNVTPDMSSKSAAPAISQHDVLVFALKNIARHLEIAAIGGAHDKALALIDIEYEVWNALAAVGDPP